MGVSQAALQLQPQLQQCDQVGRGEIVRRRHQAPLRGELGIPGFQGQQRIPQVLIKALAHFSNVISALEQYRHLRQYSPVVMPGDTIQQFGKKIIVY